MRWQWWLAAFVVGFVIEGGFIGADLLTGDATAQTTRLIVGGVLVGLLIAILIWICFAIGRFFRRRWNTSRSG